MDLLALQMVLHSGGVRLGVIEHPAVGGDPGDAVAADVQVPEVGKPSLLHAPGRHVSLHPQLLGLHAGEIAVADPHDEKERGEKHCQRHQPNGMKYLFAHTAASSL